MRDYIKSLQDQMQYAREAERYLAESRMVSSIAADIRSYESVWKEQSRHVDEVERYLAESKRVMNSTFGTVNPYESELMAQFKTIDSSMPYGFRGVYEDYKRYVDGFFGASGSSMPDFRDDPSLSIGQMIKSVYDATADIGRGYIQQVQESVGLFEQWADKISFINKEYVPVLKDYVAGFGYDGNVYASEMALEDDLGIDDAVAVEAVAASLDEIRRKFFDSSGVLTKEDGEKIFKAIESIKQKTLRYKVFLSIWFVLVTFFIAPFGGVVFDTFFKDKSNRCIEKYVKSCFADHESLCVASHNVTVEMQRDGVLSKGLVGKGAIVREVDVQKKKVKLEFFDINGNLVQGWALKKYVKPVVPRKKRKPETKRNGVRTNS